MFLSFLTDARPERLQVLGLKEGAGFGAYLLLCCA